MTTHRHRFLRRLLKIYGYFLCSAQIGLLDNRYPLTFLSLLLRFLDPGPGVAQRGRSIKDKISGGSVGVKTEIAQSLKLAAVERLCVCEGRFDTAGSQNFERVGIKIRREVLALLCLIGIFLREEMIVKTDLGGKCVPGRNPVQGGLDLSAVGCVAASRGRVVSAVQFNDPAGRVPDDVGAGDEVSVSQANFTAGSEAIEFLRRLLHKVILLNVQLTREGDFACAGGGIFGIVDGVKLFGFAFGIIVDDHLQRSKYRHYAGGGLVKVFAETVLKQGDIDGAVEFVDADEFAEVEYGLWRIAAASQAANGGHSRVVPAPDAALPDELAELALAHHGVGEV